MLIWQTTQILPSFIHISDSHNNRRIISNVLIDSSRSLSSSKPLSHTKGSEQFYPRREGRRIYLWREGWRIPLRRRKGRRNYLSSRVPAFYSPSALVCAVTNHNTGIHLSTFGIENILRFVGVGGKWINNYLITSKH